MVYFPVLQNLVSKSENSRPTNCNNLDEFYMALALEQACLGELSGDVPVGAILVCNNEIIAEAHNQKEQSHDATAHAEILVLREASKKLGRWRLSGCTLYVTLEPCPMCASAAVQCRIDRIVYATSDPKGGGTRSLYQLCEDQRLNHQLQITTGILEEPCSAILRHFFQKKRAAKCRPKRLLEGV